MMQPKAAVILKKIADVPHEPYKIKEANVHVIGSVVYIIHVFSMLAYVDLVIDMLRLERKAGDLEAAGEIVERGGLGTSGFMCS